MNAEWDTRIGQLAWDYRAARMEGRTFDVEKAIAELPEAVRDEARKLLKVGKALLDGSSPAK